MKIAVISDIHSNLTALEAVFKDISEKGIKTIFCLGDIIGYGPFPKECFDLIKNKCQIIIKGNHEDSINRSDLGADELRPVALIGVRFSRVKLEKEDVAFLAALQESFIINCMGLTLCHGAFTEPRVWKYIENEEEAEKELAKITTKICLLGHTHIPFVFGSEAGLYEDLPDDLVLKVEEKYLINVGSVGQPRDDDCRASYAVLEYCENGIIFNLHRVFYDISKTEQAILSAGLPRYLAERLFRGE